MSKSIGSDVILLRFRTKAGQNLSFAKQILSIVPETRSEPGNRQFEFYVDQDDPLNFMLYEEFVHDAALQNHRRRPEITANRAAIEPMLDGPTDTTFWNQALTNAGASGGGRGEVGHVTLVRFRVKPDTVDEMLDTIGGDLNGMRGNIRFDLNCSRNDPLDCLICARWESRAAWEAHNARPEFKEFAARIGPLLDQPMRRMLWKPATP
jgi:quinol monooxygenase YgiN